MSKIPAASPIIGEDEVSAVVRVMRSGNLVQGPEVAAFEDEFAQRFAPGSTAVAVSSGTAGLHLGLLACGVGPGDEVIVPSFTFAATANAVALTGATPVFADIEPDHFCLSPDSAASCVTSRTVGLMPVHLYGHPADQTLLRAVAARYGLAIFEDAAQAHGATWKGEPVASNCAFGMFSLYATKNMTSGEGGMVLATDEKVIRRLQLLRNQGMERRYANEMVGLNARMTDVHAAIGRVQLGRIDRWTDQRRANAAYLDAHLHGVGIPPVAPEAAHVYHQYTIRVPGDRDAFARRLADQHGVGVGIYYPIPTHRLLPFQGITTVDLPETERAAAQVLSLPVHPALAGADLARIVEAVNTVAAACA